MRIKAMQQVVDSQASRIAALAAEKEVAALGHQDEYTGQGEGNKIYMYWLCTQTRPSHVFQCMQETWEGLMIA